MPITPRNHTNFKEDLIELIKLRHEDPVDTNNIFFLKDKPFIGYGFSLKDDIDTICDQIYGKEKNKELVDAVKKAIADFKPDETKSSDENAALLYENINKAAEGSKKVSKSSSRNSLPEFKFTSEDQKCFILEQKLKPLVQEIDKKLSGSPLKKLGEVALAASSQTSGQSITPSKEHVALLVLLYLSDKKELNASLVTYVKTKSRFRAWYWLAYESFDGKRDDKFDKIRERISTGFGLFEHDAYNENLNNLYSSLGNQTDFSASNLTSVGTEHIGFRECIDVFSHLNVTKIKYYEKDEKGEESAQENTCLEFIKTYEINKLKPNTAGSVAPNLNNGSLNKNLSLEKQDPSLSKSGAELGDASAASKQEALFKPFADKLNSLLSSHTSKTFSLENIYSINLTLAAGSNASRINKLLRKREEELYKQENILILCPIKTATPIKIFQPKKSDFTIVLASQTPFDCSELNPKELNPSRANYGKVNLCELLLTDFIFNPYENSNTDHTAQSPSVSTTEEIKFKNAKTSSESLDPFTGKFASSDTVTLYRGEDSNQEDKNSSNDKTKPKNPHFTSIRRDEEEIEYKLKDGMIEMSCFKQSGNPGSNDSNSAPDQTTPYLNFTLLNFAKENNFTLRDDKASSMFDMKLLLAYGNEATPTSSPNSNFTLTVQDLIIENENGEATDIDKVYLHNCSNKTAYQSSSLVKNQDSLFKNSYTATFNIPIDTDNKKDTKLIIYSNDLSKTHTTKDIHKRSDTAVISLSYKDKNNQSFCYLRKTSLRDITNNIINVISDNEYPFKTNEDITLKAIYKQEEKDEQGNDNKKYKEVVWGYKVIKTVEYNEVSKSNPKDVVELKDKKGKEITFKISDVIKKDDLAKLKQGGYSIIFFAALKEKEKKKKETDKKKKQNNKSKDTKEVKFQFDTNYGKTHMRVDIKIPLYIKFKDDRVLIYEFEHAIKEKVFKASLRHDDVLVNKSKEESKNIKDGYYYINKNINQAQDIKIYEDDKLSKELKSDEKTNKNYQIYIDEENPSNIQNQSNTNQVQPQTGQTNINQDTKYGINLLSKDNMDKFISSFNESKSITRVDKGMWEDGDKEVKVLIDIKDYPFTLSMLKQVFTDIKKDQEYILQEMVDELNRRDTDGVQMYVKYKLDTRHRLEHFFGQAYKEVGGNKLQLSENILYKNADRLRTVFRRKFKENPNKADELIAIEEEDRPKAIANYVYSDKNGNQGGDDGWNFIGRGFFHLTGRSGYSNFNNYINKNFNTEDNIVENPTLVAEYGKYAIMSAAWFWLSNNLHKIADESKNDSNNENVVDKITYVINRGTDDQSKKDRKENYTRIRNAKIFQIFK